MVMYFDEARDLTETECTLVNSTSCNIETVIREKEMQVTECGVELEEVCGPAVDTRVEEECKITRQRMCGPRAQEVTRITEESECSLVTGAECVAGAGQPASVCETVVVEACPPLPPLDCLPGSTEPRCHNNINKNIRYNNITTTTGVTTTSTSTAPPWHPSSPRTQRVPPAPSSTSPAPTARPRPSRCVALWTTWCARPNLGSHATTRRGRSSPRSPRTAAWTSP